MTSLYAWSVYCFVAFKNIAGHLFSRSGGYSILFYCRWDWINLLFLFWYVGTSLLRTLDRIKQVVSEAT